MGVAAATGVLAGTSTGATRETDGPLTGLTTRSSAEVLASHAMDVANAKPSTNAASGEMTPTAADLITVSAGELARMAASEVGVEGHADPRLHAAHDAPDHTAALQGLFPIAFVRQRERQVAVLGLGKTVVDAEALCAPLLGMQHVQLPAGLAPAGGVFERHLG